MEKFFQIKRMQYIYVAINARGDGWKKNMLYFRNLYCYLMF